MQELFSDNIYIILFCFLLGMDGCFKGAENKKIAVLYLFIGALSITQITRTRDILILLCAGIFILCEFLTEDSDKSILFHSIWSKMADALIKSFLCYYIWVIIIALVLNSNVFFEKTAFIFEYCRVPGEWYRHGLKVISTVSFIVGLNRTLSSDFCFTDCKDFLNIFRSKFLFTQFNATPELDERLEIIAKIEDKHYWMRKSNISLSCSHFRLAFSGKKLNSRQSIIALFNWTKRTICNIIKRKRGYSTIQMQLVRTLALKTGYKETTKRKIMEFFYTPLYFSCLKKCINYTEKDDLNYKKYLLNIYAHNARCFYNINSFKANMFEFLEDSAQTRLENLSLEQVFVATMSMGNNLNLISENTLGRLLERYQLSYLDCNEILRLKKALMQKYIG